jgi:Flp pilus assembly protein TadD
VRRLQGLKSFRIYCLHSSMKHVLSYMLLNLLLLCISGSQVYGVDCPAALEQLTSLSKGGYSDTAQYLRELKKIESLCPALVDVQYEYGRLHMSTGSYNEALESFRKADSLKPRLEYQLGIARSLTYLEKYVDAENTFKDAIAKYSANWKALEGLGVLYLLLGRYRESEELFNQALQEESNADTLYYNLGVALERQGRLDEAIISYRTALTKNPRNKEARIGIVQRYFESGKVQEANTFMNEGILFYPDDREMLLMQVELLERKGEYDAALRMLERVQSKKDDPGLASRRAVLMIKDGSEKEGLRILEKLYENTNDNISVVRSYVWGLITLKHMSLAEQVSRSALESFPEDSILLNNLGVLLEESGRSDEAREAFRKAALFNPHSEVIQANHSRIP